MNRMIVVMRRPFVAVNRTLFALVVSLGTVYLIASADAADCSQAQVQTQSTQSVATRSPRGAQEEQHYFVADSFSFGVEREMKESGEKGGTEDINIGVGELQECTISKSMD